MQEWTAMKTAVATRTSMMAVVATALVAVSGTLGCGGGPSTVSSPVAAASTTEDEASLMGRHRYHHLGCLTLFIAMSADTLGVASDQQAAVEKVRRDLHARMESSRAAEQALLVTLADVLGAGNVDTAEVDAAVTRLTVAAVGVHDASADALNELHRRLTPLQRARLVDRVESHWVVWQKANASGVETAARDDGRVATLATDLRLTTDQVAKIRAGLGEPAKDVPRLDLQEITTQLRAFGDAFRNETFDARTLTAAGSANAHMARWGASQVAQFVETVVLVLTLDQRAKLASRLRENAAQDQVASEHP